VTVRVTTLKGAGAGRYYTEQLPSYYLDAGEPPGRWFGQGAALLGLEGVVDDEAFLAVMAGLHPTTGERLGRRYGDESVRGFDATFSAPKSVSVLFAIGDGQLQRTVAEAHDTAVDAVLGWVETQAHTRMRQRGHVVCIDTEGIVVGVFRQHTSRRLDPQLHTHAVIANRVAAPDRRWLALDARTIKIDQRTLSGLYHAGLRAELTRRLGVAWQSPVNGIAEIAGADPVVLAEFSQRTADIERRAAQKLNRFVDDHDREPTARKRWQLERKAAVDSRPTKPHGHTLGELHNEWRRRIRALGVEPGTLVADATDRIVRPVGIDRPQMAAMIERALGSLGERQSTWRPTELVRELAAQVPTDVTVRADELAGFLQRLADHTTATHCLDLSPPIPDGAILRRDGRPISEPAVDHTLTTQAILDQEEQIVEWADRKPRVPASINDLACRDLNTTGLSPGQADACRAVAGMAPLELIVGPAGSGKTTALTPAIEYLQHRGHTVFGVAATAAAAHVLAAETAVVADTLDKLLHEHSRPDRPPEPAYQLGWGATVIVDEAGTVSTPKLAELSRLADRHGWRVIMVGDPRQFSAVGRGGMFTHLIDTHGAIELDSIHRFTHRWEAEATRRLRESDLTVIGEYERHGRIHGGTPDAMEVAIVHAWNHARLRGETVAMMANTNHTVDRLNQLTQHHRITTGDLDPHGPAFHHDDQKLLIGDDVVTRHNQRSLRTDRGVMVKNRDHWTIQSIQPDGSVTVTGPAGTIRLPADYTREHLELGYAQTSHATQGRTVDLALLLVDGPTDSRGLYTSMTRGRHANHAYVVTGQDETAANILTQALTRDWIDQPAITRRARLDFDKTLNPSARRGGPGHDRQPPAPPPAHGVAIDNPTSKDDQAWQRISRSIEAARQRHAAEHTPSRQLRDIGR
jgi:conjugative relaxase-like TrwC/TraI family protein